MNAEAPQGQAQSEEDDLQAQLRAHYLGGAAGRLEAIDRVLAGARAQPGDPAATEALMRQLHTLAGSAGTYGFSSLSVDAKLLEKKISTARETLPLPASLLEEVAGYREEVSRQFIAAGAKLGTAQPAGAPAAEPPKKAPPVDQPPAHDWMQAPDDGFDDAAQPIQSQPAPPPPVPSTEEKPLVRRLVLAVLDGGRPDLQLAADAGTAAALAGAVLACTGPSPAARAYRAAGGEAQVVAFLEASAPPATAPSDGSAPDLPLACGSKAVRQAMLAHACDAALLCADNPDALNDARAVLRAGRPIAAVGLDPALKKLLGAAAHLLHEGRTLQEAMLALLFSLAPGTQG